MCQSDVMFIDKVKLLIKSLLQGEKYLILLLSHIVFVNHLDSL